MTPLTSPVCCSLTILILVVDIQPGHLHQSGDDGRVPHRAGNDQTCPLTLRERVDINNTSSKAFLQLLQVIIMAVLEKKLIFFGDRHYKKQHESSVLSQ